MVHLALPGALILVLLEFPLGSLAYSWNFGGAPQQCKNLTISISGSDGQPPYRVLIVPSGPTPFSNDSEVRRIVDREFSESSTTFQLNYPADSQFVAVVSDASGFGSGGTSAAAQVSSSDDSSCFDASQPVSPLWVFNIFPANQIVQCQETRIWWNASNVTGTPSFFGVIPGGESFIVPETNINVTAINGVSGTGFAWTPSIRGGTTLHVVANDGRGNGTGGSLRTTVGDNINNINSCLNSESPSSTAGNPAGGSYPTDSSGDTTGSSSSSSGTNVGAIVGGVVGGVLGLLALLVMLFFVRRRSKIHQKQNEKPVDLLQADADEGDERPPRSELPQYYEPVPFIMPEPTVDDGTDLQSSNGRPISGSERPSSRSGTPDIASTSAATRKTAPRILRPVNIIQHDDAGPSGSPKEAEEPETIELPPAYTNIRK